MKQITANETNKKSKALIFEQIIAATFFLYMAWYKEVWGDKQVVLYGIAILLTGCVAVRLFYDDRSSAWKMPPLLKMFIAYLIYSLCGVFVAINTDTLISSLVTFGCFIAVCFDCWYISSRRQDISWIYKILKIVALVCTAQVIFFGKSYYNGIKVTTMSAHNNPNTLGLVLVIGILSFSIDMNLKKESAFLLTTAADMLMLYGIVLTGSRKCLLVAIPIILFWMFYYVKAEHKEKRAIKVLVAIAVIAVAAYGVMKYIGREFLNTAAFERLTRLFSEGGTDTRAILYRDALEYFKTSPLIGIGFNQYRQWSPYGYYSHSSYAEILSCGGIIGVLIFFIPLLKCLYICVSRLFRKDTPERMYHMRMVTLALFCELFLGLGQIYIYDIFHMLVLMLISMEVSYGSFDPAPAEKTAVKVGE